MAPKLAHAMSKQEIGFASEDQMPPSLSLTVIVALSFDVVLIGILVIPRRNRPVEHTQVHLAHLGSCTTTLLR